MVLSFKEETDFPRFKDCAKHPKVEDEGFVLYYTDQCPYTSYWVPKIQKCAQEYGILLKVIHITDKDYARNVPSPVTTYALFKDRKFLTHSILTDKQFLKLAGIRE